MASIKCGNCGEIHSSVQAVRNCFGIYHTSEGSQRVTEDGFYKNGDIIYKVQKSMKSGRLYAKRLVLPDDTEGGRFEYEQGAINELTPAMKLTQEEAAAFGRLYGVCCICGHLLTNEESIERGIGPICFEKMGWG